ncbi:hypothetical protein RIF29_31486 [Crotalaria pallida]|uniref:Uncharacterized protein n=1 Tax=Crotalaria pallida TaxID=3830 RepID=A0AAN9EMI2_CROPI
MQYDITLNNAILAVDKHKPIEVHEQAILSCDPIHRERRILMKQEIGRMVLFFTDQLSLLAPNIQMVFSALALAQCEVIWYFQHVGIASTKSKTGRVVLVEIDVHWYFQKDGAGSSYS